MPWFNSYETPFQQMRSFFVNEGCLTRKMDRAHEVEIREFDPPVGWRGVVRDAARNDAIAWMTGFNPTCQSINHLMCSAQAAARGLNPYVRSEERMEYEVEFRHEVRSRVDVMLVQHRRH